MSKEKLIYLPVGILTLMVGVAGAVLAMPKTSAAGNSGSVAGTVSVGDSCTFDSAASGTYPISVTAGNSNTAKHEGIGVTCNGDSGFIIQAVGYYNGSEQTTLSGTVGTIDTADGTATTSSRWNFTATGTTGMTIASKWNGAYGAVPATETTIATFSPTTGVASTGSIDVTYRVYVTNAQPAGTYSGGVKYTVTEQ